MPLGVVFEAASTVGAHGGSLVPVCHASAACPSLVAHNHAPVSSHEIIPFVASRFYFIRASIDLLYFTMFFRVISVMNGRLVAHLIAIAQYQRVERFR